MAKVKLLPVFKTEDKERLFWENHDSTEFVDWATATINPGLENLKPTQINVES